nr:MAG TPA: hypothetical protein [Caudoviricetes sp.]
MQLVGLYINRVLKRGYNLVKLDNIAFCLKKLRAYYIHSNVSKFPR